MNRQTKKGCILGRSITRLRTYISSVVDSKDRSVEVLPSLLNRGDREKGEQI